MSKSICSCVIVLALILTSGCKESGTNVVPNVNVYPSGEAFLPIDTSKYHYEVSLQHLDQQNQVITQTGTSTSALAPAASIAQIDKLYSSSDSSRPGQHLWSARPDGDIWQMLEYCDTQRWYLRLPFATGVSDTYIAPVRQTVSTLGDSITVAVRSLTSISKSLGSETIKLNQIDYVTRKVMTSETYSLGDFEKIITVTTYWYSPLVGYFLKKTEDKTYWLLGKDLAPTHSEWTLQRFER